LRNCNLPVSICTNGIRWSLCIHACVEAGCSSIDDCEKSGVQDWLTDRRDFEKTGLTNRQEETTMGNEYNVGGAVTSAYTAEF
jgi:hypothetical protein